MVLHHKLTRRLLPLLLVVTVAIIIAIQNVDIHAFYSGWDNIHPELNIAQYAKRMIFGAWLEYQGMGGAAAQGHLAEISRLPFIYFFSLIAPQNMNRWLFIFFMYLIGGIGMYIYLICIWLNKNENRYRFWIASVSAIYYLLNVITLQQFYISFEMFTVQFAFLPFLLLSIHLICQKINTKNVLLFIVVQLLIAPSAHTPTVYYLGFFLSLCYAFFLSLQSQKKITHALRTMGIVCALTLCTNAYWLIPNVYFVLHNSRYIVESRANQIFGMESIWSVREASTLYSLLTGIHYLFNWENYNFTTHRNDYIFGVWKEYVVSPLVIISSIVFNLLCFFGAIRLFFSSQKGKLKYALLLFACFSAASIWMGLLLPSQLVTKIFEIKPIQEAFRNAFTKFSIIYVFLITIFLSQFIEKIILTLLKSRLFFLKSIVPRLSILFLFVLIFSISLPSFLGHFINPSLKVIYPSEYFEMFSFFKTQNPNTRVLELPYYSHEGWVLYDWSTERLGNGYQGIGFQFFGIPQPLLTPDFARWTETSDFFYHELKNSLNSKNSAQMKKILNKYKVGFIIVDNNAINKYSDKNNTQMTHTFLYESGLTKVWSKNNLTVYGNTSVINEDNQLIIPKEIAIVSTHTDRVVWDSIYNHVQDYIVTDKDKTTVLYPFANATTLQSIDYQVKSNGISLTRKIPRGDYQLTIPSDKKNIHSTLVSIKYVNDQLTIIFPQTFISSTDSNFRLPQLDDMVIPVVKKYPSIYLWIGDKQFNLKNNQTIIDTITFSTNETFEVSIAEKDETDIIQNVSKIEVSQPEWKQWTEDVQYRIYNTEAIRFETLFPHQEADMLSSSSHNCTEPIKGIIDSSYNLTSTTYYADNFGVNCNQYVFPFMNPNQTYILQVKGTNIQGRSIKLFIDSALQYTLSEEFLLPSKTFNTFINLLSLSENSPNPYLLNWETRSFGGQSENKLSALSVYPAPLEKIAQIYATDINTPITVQNQASQVIIKSKLTPYFYTIQAQCNDEQSCYVGINQSFDDLWVAFDSRLSILAHTKYNNWANMWNMQGSQIVYILYLPGILSLLAIICLFFCIGVLLTRLAVKKYKT